jgi:GntR family transcriptional regulator
LAAQNAIRSEATDLEEVSCRNPTALLTRATLSSREASGPLYHQLKELLRGKIESGEWKTGQRIPPEMVLCRAFHVSRATTTQALNDLERMGLVERRQGKGTFVAPPRFVRSLAGFYSVTEETLARGLIPAMKVLSIDVVPPTPHQATELQMERGARVIRIERLRMVNGEPVVMDVCMIPQGLCSGLENDDLEAGLLHDILSDKYGIRVVEQEKWAEPVVLDDYEAGLLRTKRGALGLQVERVAYADGRTPVEFRRTLIAGHRCRYVVEVARP